MIPKQISYGSDQHKRIVNAIRARWQLSRDRFAARYAKWSEMEKEAMVYINESEDDASRSSKRKEGKPQFTTIQVPYSYAQMLAAHTYATSVFLSRSPIHQYLGRHSFTAQSEKAVEALIDYQTREMLAAYYVWFYDTFKYGIGVLGTYWSDEYETVSEIVNEPRVWMGVSIPGTERKVKKTRRVQGFSGNRAYNVRPQDFFPDPRVPISKFQDGEFCGRYVEVGYNQIKKRAGAGYYFNTEQLFRTRPSNWRRERGASQLTLPNQTGGESPAFGGSHIDKSDPLARLEYIELLEMHIELIPREWGLGEGEDPEKWCFTLGNDAVLIGAWPLGLLHNKYPFDIMEYELEGYGLFKRSMLETLKPLNDTLSWLFNSHFYNVRKILNDQIIVDPSRVTMKDLLDTDAARIIRLKPEGYGQDPGGMIHQLQVVDVTQNHINVDARVVMDLMNRVGRVNDNIMGLLNAGGRKSATEVRSSNSASVNGLKTLCEQFSAQGWTSHAMKMLQSTQQFYDDEKMYRIAGSLMNDAAAYITVTPDLIAGAYDFVPVDGTLPVDRQAQAYLWAEIMKQMTAFPQIMLEYDVSKIFAHVAHLGGVKNLEQFKVQVTPDEELARLARIGQVLPIGGGSGGRSKGTPAGPQGAKAVPADGAPPNAGAPQLAGVGPLA